MTRDGKTMMLKIAEVATQTAKHTLAPLKYIPSHIVEGPTQVRTVHGPGAHKEGWLVCEVSADEHGAEIVRAVNCHDELLAELKRLSHAYVGLLETGYDRIIAHGGTCDPVDVMERNDPSLRSARAAIARAMDASALTGERDVG
jgi:hypothetical protein